MAHRCRSAGKASAAAASQRQWKVGDLVLAKVKGFPAWPAMNEHDQSMQNYLPQSMAQHSGSNRKTLDAVPYFAPRYCGHPIQKHRCSFSYSSGSFGTLPGSYPLTVDFGNNVSETNGPVDDKAYLLPPLPPISSNSLLCSRGSEIALWRQTSCSLFTKKFQEFQDMNGGDFSAGHNRARLAPCEINEGGRLSTHINSEFSGGE